MCTESLFQFKVFIFDFGFGASSRITGTSLIDCGGVLADKFDVSELVSSWLFSELLLIDLSSGLLSMRFGIGGGGGIGGAAGTDEAIAISLLSLVGKFSVVLLLLFVAHFLVGGTG